MHHFTRPIIHGKHLGRTLGYPTANMYLESKSGIPSWVYAVVGSLDDRTLRGVGVYFPETSTFEAHFFDFHDDIYGRELSIEILYKIRENRKFDSLDALKIQIEKDILYVHQKWQSEKFMSNRSKRK